MSAPLFCGTRVLLSVIGAGACFVAFAVQAQTDTATAPSASPSPLAAQVPATDARGELHAEREAQTQRLDAAERACYLRFFTTQCLIDVARSRRAMQAESRHKEAALDVAERQQRAQEARRRLQEKFEDQTQRQNSSDPEPQQRAPAPPVQ